MSSSSGVMPFSGFAPQRHRPHQHGCYPFSGSPTRMLDGGDAWWMVDGPNDRCRPFTISRVQVVCDHASGRNAAEVHARRGWYAKRSIKRVHRALRVQRTEYLRTTGGISEGKEKWLGAL